MAREPERGGGGGRYTRHDRAQGGGGTCEGMEDERIIRKLITTICCMAIVLCFFNDCFFTNTKSNISLMWHVR